MEESEKVVKYIDSSVFFSGPAFFSSNCNCDIDTLRIIPYKKIHRKYEAT